MHDAYINFPRKLQKFIFLGRIHVISTSEVNIYCFPNRHWSNEGNSDLKQGACLFCYMRCKNSFKMERI